MNKEEFLTSSYDFNLPDDLIASTPAVPRDSAKLLVYDRRSGKTTHTVFSEIERFIPKECALIFNDTKVIKARLFGKKTSGAKMEILINKPMDAHNINVYIRGRVRPGSVIVLDRDITVHVKELCEDASRIVNFYSFEKLLRFEELLHVIDEIGHVPLPPYIKREDDIQDVKEYQSVFAKEEGAVAAPTASLHFTKELHESICAKHSHAYITLHVGSGTFKPVECDDIREHPMHSEYFDISNEAKNILDSDMPILGVGTTSTRTIEFYARNKNIQRGEANLFLHPGNKPLRVDHLLTNFHLPKSTLLMLVASFAGLKKSKELYDEAIKERYRFYSYGDAMLIL